MKKIFITLFAIANISFFCAIQPPLAIAEGIETFTGKIESVKRYFKSSPPKWEHAMVTIVADNGGKTVVYAVKATTVTDVSGKDMCQGGRRFGTLFLKNGERVEVKYSTVKKGHNEAISVRCVPVDYVQQPTVPATPVNTPAQTIAQEKNTLIGTVKDIAGIAPGLSNNWTYCKITILADSGNESVFFINKNTSLTDENGVTNPPLPKKDQKVEVKYSIGEDGRNAAVSLRYLLSGPTQQPIASSTSKPENIFTGKVQNVTSVLGRSPNWTYNRIDVIIDNGDTSDFFVMRDTVITDANGNNLSGKRIKKGKKVEIKYSILTDSSAIINGQKGADSIRYLD